MIFMKIRDNDNLNEQDISLEMLRKEENEFEIMPDEEMSKKQVLIYLIIIVIAFALCGISYVIGVKMGRSLERKQLVLKQEISLSPDQTDIKPISHPDKEQMGEKAKKINAKPDKTGHEKEELGIQKVEKDSQEFMILQNAAKKIPGKKTKPGLPKEGDEKKAESEEKVETKKPTKEAKEHKNTGKFFTIQIAATEDEKKAESLKKSYIRKGYDAFISTVIVRNKTYYRIRLGKYPVKEDALLAAEELKNREKLSDVWVTDMN